MEHDFIEIPQVNGKVRYGGDIYVHENYQHDVKDAAGTITLESFRSGVTVYQSGNFNDQKDGKFTAKVVDDHPNWLVISSPLLPRCMTSKKAQQQHDDGKAECVVKGRTAALATYRNTHETPASRIRKVMLVFHPKVQLHNEPFWTEHFKTCLIKKEVTESDVCVVHDPVASATGWKDGKDASAKSIRTWSSYVKLTFVDKATEIPTRVKKNKTKSTGDISELSHFDKFNVDDDDDSDGE